MIAALSFFVVPLFSLTTVIQQNQTEVFEGIYDGKEDYGYNFIGLNEDDEEYTMTFHNIETELLKSFDLESEKLIGETFVVTYTTTIETETDEDGFENEFEVNTIVFLKKKK